jgi:hypothetical protein
MEPIADGLTLEEARVLTERLARLRNKAKDLRERYQREEAGFTKVIEGYFEVFPELSREASPSAEAAPSARRQLLATGRPAGMSSVDAAVAVVESSSAGTWLTAVDVTEELLRRGWLGNVKNDLNTVRTSLGRAVEAGRLQSTRLSGQVKGYRPGPIDTEPPVGAGGSVSVTTSGPGGDAYAQAQGHGHP